MSLYREEDEMNDRKFLLYFFLKGNFDEWWAVRFIEEFDLILENKGYAGYLGLSGVNFARSGYASQEYSSIVFNVFASKGFDLSDFVKVIFGENKIQWKAMPMIPPYWMEECLVLPPPKDLDEELRVSLLKVMILKS